MLQNVKIENSSSEKELSAKTPGIPAAMQAPSPGNIISHIAWSEKMGKASWQFFAVPLLLFFAIPLLALFVNTTPEKIFYNLSQAQVAQAINLSLLTSVLTTGITLVAGTPVAYMLSQRRFRVYRLVDTLIDLPTVLPPSVAGVALLMAFGRRGLFGAFFLQWGISLPFTTMAVVIAQTFIAAPYYIKAAAIGFAAIDPELKQAAALDGASRWQVFRHVTLPLSWVALLSGSVMTWARALGEFGATIIFAGNLPGRTQTMPLAIYLGFEINIDVALTLAVVLVCFSFLTLIIVKGLLHRRLEDNL